MAWAIRWHERPSAAFSRRETVGWLARSALGQRAANHLEQGVRAVLVFIPSRYLKDPLADERGKGVASLPLSPLWHRLGDGLAKTQLLVHFRQPQEPTVRGEASSVEGGFHGEGALPGLKTHPAVCGTIRQEGAFFCWVESWTTRP